MIFIIFFYMYLSCHCLMCLALPSIIKVPLLIYPCPVPSSLENTGRSWFLFITFSCSPPTSLSNFSFRLSYYILPLSCSIWRFIYLNKLWYKPVDGKEDIFRIFHAANDRKSQLSWLIICIYIRIYFRINYL